MASTLMELTEARGKLAATRDNLKGLFDKKTADGKLDWVAADHDHFKAWDKQAQEEHAKVKEWEYLDSAEKANAEGIAESKKPLSGNPLNGGGRGYDREPEQKSIGEMVTDSTQYKQFKAMNCQGVARIELPDRHVTDFKTTLSTSAGFAPFIQRTGDVVPFAIRRLVVQDLMPSIPVAANALKYMEETTRTANAASVAEGATKPESARVWTERTVLVEVVATTLPVTEQQMDDVPMIMGLINSSLGMEVELQEETELLTGNGTSPNLQGFLTKTGVQTQAKGSDPTPTAFFKGLTLVRFTGFAEPSAAVWHPTDWQNVVTIQDTTGRYIFGNPNDINIKSIWGVPAVITPAETLGTILVGDFRMYAYIARRQGLRIDVGYVNDNFAKNLKTIRAETRLALVIRRPSAFCTITGN